MKRLDDKIRSAFQALEQAVPEGYFDDFASRVDARLEGEALNQEMSNMNGDNDRDLPPGVAVPEAKPADTWEDDEHSGLAEITELASKTKKRITRRATTQTETEEAMLLSASHSGLSAVVLPEPGKDKPTFEDAEEATAPAVAGAATAARVTREERSGIPVWVYGAVGLVAVAAVVFFVIRGGGKSADKGNEVAQSERGAATANTDNAPPPAGNAAPAKTPAPVTPSVAANKDAEKDGDTTDTATKNADDGAPVDKADGDAADTKSNDGDSDGAKTKVASNAPSHRRPARHTNRRSRRQRTAHKTAKAKHTTRTRPKTTAKPRKKKDQSVEDLLGQFDDDKKKKQAPKKVVKKPSKKRLSRADIQHGMRSIRARVQGCYNKYKKAGLVMINVHVSPQARVKASASGSFAGTPTGNCVAAAVRSVHFPKFSGPPMSFPYPFRLNP